MLSTQIIWLFVLAIPIACISWTVTHEALFKEPHEYCVKRYRDAKHILTRKFFYLFTCEYCLSHYIAAVFLLITHYRLLFDDWRGYLIALLSLVWIANIYMSLYNLVRIDIKVENTKAEVTKEELEEKKE